MKTRRFACAALLAVALIATAPAFAQVPPVPPVGPPASPSPSPTPSPSEPSESNPPESPQEPSEGQTQQPRQSQLAPPVISLVIPNIPRTPSQTTARVVGILAPLAERGMPIEQALVMAISPFPVAGQASFSHDYGFPRYTPYPHLHEGTDIFADYGTPIVASVAGTVTGMASTAIGGVSLYIAGDDSHGYYYAHLQGFAEGLQNGQRVEAGTIIGYVGDTGNAVGTPPHLHMEIYPPVLDKRGRVVTAGVLIGPDGMLGGITGPTDPKPYLDKWLVTAEQNAQALVVKLIERLAVVGRQTHFERRVTQLIPTGDRSSATAIWLSSDAAASNAAAQLLAPSGTPATRTAKELRLAAIRMAVDAPNIWLTSVMGGPGSVTLRQRG